MPEQTRPNFYRNWISYAGTALAVLAFICFLFLIVFQSLGAPIPAPYAGLVVFIVTPAFLILGLLLIPFGIVLEWWRWKRHMPPSIGAYPRIDLNLSHDRRMFGFVTTVTLILVFLSVFGSYKAYQYTESVTFCGRLCHRQMEPEYVSHQISPHAHVRCVDCHVGPGAQSLLWSKMEGTVQLYHTVTNTVPRPIPAPTSSLNLRPARAACTQCHWPAKFYGDQQLQTVHYLPDQQNTEWDISLLLKVGGAGPWNPQAKGIHWHVGPNTRIEYSSTDRQSQNIPWVRYTDLKTGKTLVYSTQGDSSSGKVDPSTVSTMDCVDCHTRPTHAYNSPSFLMNSAMAAGYVDRTLPDVKTEGVQLLAATYNSQQAAAKAIADGMQSYYRSNYPQVAQAKAASITQAISSLQSTYRENFFPYMKVNWQTYADNIGHLNSPGCFRCHDGLHKTSGGEVIRKDCTLCHTISQQGTPAKMAYSTQPTGLPFQHPVDIGSAWQTVNCDQCHTGASP